MILYNLICNQKVIITDDYDEEIGYEYNWENSMVLYAQNINEAIEKATKWILSEYDIKDEKISFDPFTVEEINFSAFGFTSSDGEFDFALFEADFIK